MKTRQKDHRPYIYVVTGTVDDHQFFPEAFSNFRLAEERIVIARSELADLDCDLEIWRLIPNEGEEPTGPIRHYTWEGK